jgi:hypothetical protein
MKYKENTMIVQHIKIKGQIKDGKLEVELPDNVTDGEAELIVPVATSEDDDLTPEEIQEYLNFKGLPFSEIETGGWEDREIEDSVQFVEELRRKAWRKHELE